ncbi:MAG: hypothetical protein IIV40_01585, partial [Oscillospiraceae bacterium]|nr:hypothetical protein [Oscillospiraceae bacterium]
AYLFTPEAGGFESSYVVGIGIAEGTFAVNVTMNIEFDFAAEDGLATVEHIWRTERGYLIKPVHPGYNGEDKEDKEDEEPEEKNPETGAPVFFG